MSQPITFAHRNLPRLLLEAREAVLAHTRPDLRAHGLSDQQWRVLRVLGEHAQEPDGVETGRSAREAFLPGPSLTGGARAHGARWAHCPPALPEGRAAHGGAGHPAGFSLGARALENH